MATRALSLCVAAALLFGNTFAQTIRGIVLDAEDNTRLGKASVKLARAARVVVTDDLGGFELELSGMTDDDSLVVTYVGYERHAQAVTPGMLTSPVSIALKKQVTLLHEVSVISDFWRKTYSPQQLSEDYTKFITILEKVHTGLFDHMPERKWAHLKDSAMNLIRTPMTHSEFYQLIALHVGRIRNQHTRHGVTDSWYKQKQNIFPFNVRYFGDKLYVAESLMKEPELQVARGTEILSVNGRTPAQMKAMIWPYIPADGYAAPGRTTALNDYFPWYYSLFVEETNAYTLRLKKSTGETVTVETPGLRDSFAHLSFQQLWRWRKTALELTLDHDLKTAYFRIDDSRVFPDSLQIYFQRIVNGGMRNLIIDLRGSGGIREEEQVAELYAHLITRPSRIYEKLEVKSNDASVFDKDFSHKPYGKSVKHLKETFFDKLVRAENGMYRWQEESYLKTIEPSQLHFSGTVYILTDGRNYSASTDFTSVAAQLPNVFVVGEETGGGYRSYVSGAMYGLVLPNSKIGVKVPTWKSTLAIPDVPSQHGRGVLPDFLVAESFEDFVNGRDAVKAYAYALIRERK